MIATPKRDPRPLRRVVLVKHTDDAGFPAGWEYEWTYTLATREQAEQRAKLALRRDYPDENPAHWEPKP